MYDKAATTHETALVMLLPVVAKSMATRPVCYTFYLVSCQWLRSGCFIANMAVYVKIVREINLI